MTKGLVLAATVAAAGFAALAPRTLDAQDPERLAPEVRPGTRVRARLTDDHRGLRPVGRLVAFDTAYLVVARNGRADSVRTATIERLEVSLGGGNGSARQAAMRGAMAGALVGGIIGHLSRNRCQGECEYEAVFAVPAGVVLGAIAGIPVGLSLRGEGWRTVWRAPR